MRYSDRESRPLRKYDDLSDEELIRLIRDDSGDKEETGSETAVEVLFRRYRSLINGKARSLYILGGETEDLVQEGMIGLYKAIRDYDSEKDASFQTFANLCVTRQLYTAVQASGRKKHMPLNTAVSLDMSVGEDQDEDSELQLMDALIPDNEQNPEEQMIESENLLYLEEKIKNELSPFENQVLDLYLAGMNYTDIAEELGKDSKSADNALQRIRSKLRKAINP